MPAATSASPTASTGWAGSGGGAVDFWMRSTLGFRKSQGVWKIAHGHSSVPFAMDGSFRALLDLQP